MVEVIMAKDKHGNDLQIGDRVTIECVVTHVFDGDDGSNCVFNTVELFNDQHASTIHINSKQAAKSD